MAEIFEYKCPCCGGAIGFDSSLQKMKCPYCDTEFEIDVLKEYDEQLKTEVEETISWNKSSNTTWQEDEENICSYICKSCGGEIIGDVNTVATSCPFCGNSVVISGKISGDLKPDLVIPFKLDKKAAKEALKKHYEGKRLLPKSFKEENRLEEIKGIYVPFWIFDADADVNIRYKASKVRMWSDSNYNYTETSFFAVTREGNIGFNFVPVDGSSKLANDLMESIEPFDISEAVDFKTAYLAGYFADKYDVDSEQSERIANDRIKQSSQDAFASTIAGYSSLVPEFTGIKLYNNSVKYALYPVWLLNTTWDGKKYTFAMNGQTGKFVGELPMDKKLYRKWLWGLTGAITAGVFTLMTLIWLI